MKQILWNKNLELKLNYGIDDKVEVLSCESVDGKCIIDLSSANIPVKDGYEFVGWFDERGNELNVIREHSMGNKHLIAQFRKRELY